LLAGLMMPPESCGHDTITGGQGQVYISGKYKANRSRYPSQRCELGVWAYNCWKLGVSIQIL